MTPQHGERELAFYIGVGTQTLGRGPKASSVPGPPGVLPASGPPSPRPPPRTGNGQAPLLTCPAVSHSSMRTGAPSTRTCTAGRGGGEPE